jgi:hypothetical protein
MAWSKEDLTAKRFGRSCLSFVKSRVRGSKMDLFFATCGVECEVLAGHLTGGNKKSCGCLKRNVLGDTTRKHGMAKQAA